MEEKMIRLLNFEKTQVGLEWLDKKGTFRATFSHPNHPRDTMVIDFAIPKGVNCTYVGNTVGLELFEIVITNCGHGHVILSVACTDELYDGAAWLFSEGQGGEYALESRVA